MEKFTLIFRGGENPAHNAQDPEFAQENMQAWMNWMGNLAQSGTLVDANPMQPTGKQVIGINKVVTNGVYTSSGESVGIYPIINANSIDDSVEISKDCPIFNENGKVEVRPVQKMEM